MRTLIEDRRGVYGLALLVLAAVWGGLEWLFSDPVRLFSLRLGFLVALLSVPGMQWIYDYGLGADEGAGTKAMVLSFLYKGSILLGSAILLEATVDISLPYYVLPLFFTIFSLGFVAIYLARLRSNISF